MTYIYQTNYFKLQCANTSRSGTDITRCQWAAGGGCEMISWPPS